MDKKEYITLQPTNHLVTFLNIQPVPRLVSSRSRLGSTAMYRKHFNDTLYCRIHIDTVFKAKYQRYTPLGKGGKLCSVILFPRLNQSKFASPRAKATPSVALPHLPVLEIWNAQNPLGRILLLLFLQYICWYDYDWAEVQVRKCLCGLLLRKKKLRLI